MVKGIHHISMKCERMDEFETMKDFYQNLIGLPVKREWDGGIMFDAGNALIEVFSSGGNKGKGAIDHLAFQTDNVDAIIEKVKQAGYEVFIEPTDIVIPSEPAYPARMAFCRGPLGEEIEFFQER